jgi:hypothetical protein
MLQLKAQRNPKLYTYSDFLYIKFFARYCHITQNLIFGEKQIFIPHFVGVYNSNISSWQLLTALSSTKRIHTALNLEMDRGTV